MKEARLINHYHTYITCTNKKASWTISTGKGENLKIHHYTTRKQKSTI
ncbi:MAG: hypothetical protein QXX51_08985 [Candidatus Bathyarchaeia archaeon]